MSTLQISVVQTTSSDLDPSVATKAALDAVSAAAESGSKLIVLPELWTGLGLSTYRHADDIAADGVAAEAELVAIAAKHDCYIVGSRYRAREDGRLANAAAVIGPEGVVSVYEKTHLFDAARRTDLTGAGAETESDKVVAGTDLTPVPTPFGDLGITICSDLRFPEPYRVLAIRGARIIVNCSAFLAPRFDHWEFMLRTRAVENQVYVVGSGQFGTDAASGVGFVGRSMIVDPWGLVIATASDRVGTVTTVVDLDLIDEVRHNYPLLEQRRPEMYSDLSAPVGADGLLPS